jgi:AraC family transcriptional regulator
MNYADCFLRIEHVAEKKLVGTKLSMSRVKGAQHIVWSQFMPRRHEIQNAITSDLISLHEYPVGYFEKFDPTKEFDYWALQEVSNHDNIPAGLMHFTLASGDYAVFLHRGSAVDVGLFQYIFAEWIPNSEYNIDERPHFEVLGQRYKQGDPASEEEIFIPIKLKI